MAQASNTLAIQSPQAPLGAVGSDCTQASLWESQFGTGFLQSQALGNNPAPLVLGEVFEIAPGALIIEQLPGTNETELMAIRALRGRITGGIWVQFHTGNPGSTGTDNVISELGRILITQDNFTLT